MKIRTDTIYLFFIGFGIGFLLNLTFSQDSDDIPNLKLNKDELVVEIHPSEIKKLTVDDVKKIRILCFVNTSQKFHSQRGVHLLQTWGKHCDKILFASTLTDINMGAIGFNVTEDQNHMWGKVTHMLQYIHKNFIDDYDWFFKCDDDSFSIVENLRYLLAAYSPEDPIYFESKYNTTPHKWGYFAVGGYAMSKKTVRVFVEQLLSDEKFFHGPNRRGCHLDDQVEDWDISVCFDNYNVHAGDGRDILKRKRFHIFPANNHVPPRGEDWDWNTKYYWNEERFDHWSNYSALFQHVHSKYQYSLYYMAYKLQAYGIQRRYPPPPPKRKSFTEVTYVLDQERINATLRGY